MTSSRKQTSLPQVKEEPLRFNPDGILNVAQAWLNLATKVNNEPKRTPGL